MDVPLVLDLTVGWDANILTYFDDRMLRLEHCAMLGAKSVQVVEVRRFETLVVAEGR